MKYTFILFLTFCTGFAQTKFEYIAGYPAIYDTVNQLTYSFDSGAPTFLSSEKTIGKKSLSFSLIKDINGKFKFKGKQKLDLKLPEIGNIKRNALNIGTVTECLNIDLFLGIEVLENKRLHFNFKQQTFEVLDELEAINTKQFREIPIKYNSYDAFYYVVTEINGKKYKLLLDLGFGGEIAIKNRFKGTDFSPEIVDALYFGANSHQTKTIENYKNTKLTFSNEVELFNTVSKSKDNKFNLIGIDFFKQFEEVIFDFPKQKIYLSKAKLPAENKGSSIGFNVINNEVVISSISHNSRYYKAGFRLGDVIEFHDTQLQQKVLETPCEINKIVDICRIDNFYEIIFNKNI